MRIPALVLVTLLLLTVGLPSASAHAVRAPCAWEQRLLHDHNDDLGGVGGKHGHEIHALDLVEAWDETLGDVLVFRLAYEGGYGGTLAGERPDRLRLALSFQAGSTTKTFEWSTTDNAAFTGTFDKVVQPTDLTTACNSTQVDEGARGDRQVIEGWVGLAKNGIAKGTTLSKFKVDAFAGSTKADTMGEGTSQGGDDAWFKVAQYEVGARPKILDGRLDWQKVEMKVGENKTVIVSYDNRLDQTLDARITYTGPGGTKGTFHLNDDIGYRSDSIAWQQPKGEATLHLYLVPSEPVSGAPVTIDMYGDMGPYTGHVQRTLMLDATTAAISTDTSQTTQTTQTTTTDTDDPAAEESPTIGALLLVVTFAALIAIRRKD